MAFSKKVIPVTIALNAVKCYSERVFVSTLFLPAVSGPKIYPRPWNFCLAIELLFSPDQGSYILTDGDPLLLPFEVVLRGMDAAVEPAIGALLRSFPDGFIAT